MNVEERIEAYIAGQPEKKQEEMRALHRLALGIAPDRRLWFLDGKDDQGKTISNPNIGYGYQLINYADGKTREFYQLSLSANTTGISLYLIGLDDKTYLARTFGARIGKANVTGYCIKFRSLADLDRAVLEEMFRFGLGEGDEAAEPTRTRARA
jgi:hypothetical protein